MIPNSQIVFDNAKNQAQQFSNISETL